MDTPNGVPHGTTTGAVSVRVIKRTGNQRLVEWREDDLPRRGLVPRSAVVENGNGHTCQHPEWAIPYGVRWGEKITLATVTTEMIERELYRVGIFTPEDLLARPQAAAGALQAVYSVSLSALIQAAVSIQQEARNER